MYHTVHVQHTAHYIYIPCYCILTGSEVLPELRLGLDEELWGRRGAEWRWMVVDGRCRGDTIRAVWWRRHGVSTSTGWGGGRWPQKPVDLLSIVEATSVYLRYGHIDGENETRGGGGEARDVFLLQRSIAVKQVPFKTSPLHEGKAVCVCQWKNNYKKKQEPCCLAKGEDCLLIGGRGWRGHASRDQKARLLSKVI